MTGFFIRHPLSAIVAALLLTIFGLLAAFSLPVAQYPEIAPPMVMVSTTYIGADAEVLNDTVAQVIENEVNGVEGIDYMKSTSDSSGAYYLEIFFRPEIDSDTAAVNVQNRVSSALPQLPDEVQSYGVTTTKSSEDMALVISLISPNGIYDSMFLKNYAQVYFMDKIKRVYGIGSVTEYTEDFAMRIWLNPEKLASHGLTVTDVTDAVKEQNKRASVGALGKMPADEGQETQSIGRAANRRETPEDFASIILRAEPDGRYVRLGDVAEITNGVRDMNYVSLQDGLETAAFSVALTNDANAIETIGKVNAILAEEARSFPPGMEYRTLVDSTRYVAESMKEVSNTFWEALALVVAIMYLFLRDPRATIIAVLTIPVSLIATFAAFKIAGFSINTLTLFAMVLAIGMVVDDAIVVIESVEQHLEKGGGILEATTAAMKEVEGPVLATTFVLAAVFIPVAFLSGMTGILYRQFALTIVIAISLSTFVALSLTPALCVMLIRAKSTADIVRPVMTGADQNENGFFARFERGLGKVRRAYLNTLTVVMRRAFAVPVCVALLAAGAAALWNVLPSEFIPTEDQGYFMVNLNLPEGASMNRTIESIKRFSAELAKESDIRSVLGIGGFDLMSDGAKPNAGVLFVPLEDWGNREKSVDEIMENVEELALSAPEATVIPINPPSLPGLSRIGGFSMMLLDATGHTAQEMAEVSQKIEAAANDRPEFSEVSASFNISTPFTEFAVDEEKAKALGVSLDDVYTTMRVNFGGDEVNNFTRFGHNYKVVLQAQAQYRNDKENAKFLFVKNQDGGMVPLDTLLHSKSLSGSSQISRYDGVKCVNFEGQPGEGYSSGQAMDALEEIAKEIAPTGFQIAWTGESRQLRDAQGTVLKVMGLSLLFVFLCLVALYESWSIPFSVLLSVPAGVFGALLTELSIGRASSIYMQIGILMVIGLAAKNAILIAEFAKLRMDAGMKAVPAVFAAAKLRLRPILMTALTSIIGCLPLAFASGAGAEARVGMGAAVVGGMSAATILGLFFVPVLFSLLARKKQ